MAAKEVADMEKTAYITGYEELTRGKKQKRKKNKAVDESVLLL